MSRRNRNGFTLIELLVATAILGIAVAALLGGLTDSMRAAARVSEYDKVTLAGKQKMEELLVDSHLPRFQWIEGKFDSNSGWRTRVTPWDAYQPAVPGMAVTDRVELEVWWMSGTIRKMLKLEGYRRGTLQPGDFDAGALRQ